MRKESSLPIRLDTGVKQKVQNIAEDLGLTVSALVRMLVKSFTEEFEKCDGQIMLPPKWQSSVRCQKTKPAVKSSTRPKVATKKNK